ncbi:hypothetical protein [Gottfriedia acidiceleris]|uniref:hypothetical protein n=1 Tax=Gottfriedia acidiceleris TaxID=371036 RepID=UPI0030008B87
MGFNVRAFFEERNLVSQFYYYELEDGGIEGLSLEYLIDTIVESVDEMNKDAAISIFLLKELNASDDFILDVYFPTVAEKLIEDFIRLNKWKAIERKIQNNETVTFTIQENGGQLKEFQTYKAGNDKYKIKESGFDYQVFSSFNELSTRLEAVFNQAVFNNYKRVNNYL